MCEKRIRKTDIKVQHTPQPKTMLLLFAVYTTPGA